MGSHYLKLSTKYDNDLFKVHIIKVYLKLYG